MSKWPDEVPVLEASDLCIVEYDGKGCGCLLKHATETFCPISKGGWERLDEAMLAAHNTLGTGTPSRNDGDWITTFADKGLISRETAARVWNLAMAKLGYVVGNPECDRRGRLKPVKK